MMGIKIISFPDNRIINELEQFYGKLGLSLPTDISCAVILREEGEIIASGLRCGNIIQGIGVTWDRRSEGLSLGILSELIKEAAERDITHLFLFTKPANKKQFEASGFHTIAITEDAIMMENRRGIEKFLDGIPLFSSGKTGFIAMHANPFTKGHQYLAEKASSECDHVYVVVVGEDDDPFSPEERLLMVKKGLSHLGNVTVFSGGSYIVSYATFPDYFYPDRVTGRKANCRLDLDLFCKRIAVKLGITDRYVGEEPFSIVTSEYNQEMKRMLPAKGINIHEIERMHIDDNPVSALEVRKAMENNDEKTALKLTPSCNHEEILSKMNKEKLE